MHFMSMANRLKAQEAMTPKAGQGFNVVGVDDYQPAGEELYLVRNFATRQEAEAFAKAYRKKTSDEIVIYGPPEPTKKALVIPVDTLSKAKYKSRKRVGGKWVYEYDEPKKPRSSAQLSLFGEKSAADTEAAAKETKRLRSAIWSKFPAQNRGGRAKGGSRKLMLTGDVAKRLGAKEYAIVSLDKMPLDQLKQLAGAVGIQSKPPHSDPPGVPSDPVAYNTELSKEIKKLKKMGVVESVKQGYRGTGNQKHRRQLFVRNSKTGLAADLWLEDGQVQLGGVMFHGLGGRPSPISTEGRTPAEVVKDLAVALKGNPEGAQKSLVRDKYVPLLGRNPKFIVPGGHGKG